MQYKTVNYPHIIWDHGSGQPLQADCAVNISQFLPPPTIQNKDVQKNLDYPGAD